MKKSQERFETLWELNKHDDRFQRRDAGVFNLGDHPLGAKRRRLLFVLEHPHDLKSFSVQKSRPGLKSTRMVSAWRSITKA